MPGQERVSRLRSALVDRIRWCGVYELAGSDSCLRHLRWRHQASPGGDTQQCPAFTRVNLAYAGTVSAEKALAGLGTLTWVKTSAYWRARYSTGAPP